MTEIRLNLAETRHQKSNWKEGLALNDEFNQFEDWIQATSFCKLLASKVWR
jgi:hypothetical protein